MTEWNASREILDDLVEATEQTAFLSVPRENEAVCIDWAPGRGIGVLILKPGRTLPYYAGAAGRTMLAFGQESEAYLAKAPFARLTPSTLVTADELRVDIGRTRVLGYAFSDEDATVGIGALGMPIRSSAGQLLGCVSIGGLAGDMHAHRDDFLAALGDAARRLAEHATTQGRRA
ncbi:IclR family transcriptional regulator [Frondihabitans sp. PhB188]|uniref:IclR family transcriptional regulator n=1 Tax=Frondihabitans sp. PhB188 TaxID=2485200 RepID=UPI000F46E3F9|nr:IclR family transcriptional regulator C-terminal domain-containing protein [Frondihabitans sp. PhB188]